MLRFEICGAGAGSWRQQSAAASVGAAEERGAIRFRRELSKDGCASISDDRLFAVGIRCCNHVMDSSSRRLQPESRQQRLGKKIFSAKVLRTGRQAVASYDYVVVAVQDGRLLF